MNSEEIDKLLFKYYKIKEKIKEYQEYLEDVKIKIEDNPLDAGTQLEPLVMVLVPLDHLLAV